MATQTPNKTPNIVVLTHQAAAHPITIVGSSIDVRTKYAVTIFLYHGYISDSAAPDTNPGKFKVQTRPDEGEGSVDEHWKTVAEYVVKGTTPDEEAMTATEAAGVKVLTVASTASFAPEDLLYIEDTSVLAASEWAECQQLGGGPSIDILDGLTTQKDSADIILNDASIFTSVLDLRTVESFRVVWSHEGGAGANGHVLAMASYHDSESST